jgi:predicted RNA-binding protein YlxR (DUF448 family)
MAGKPQGPERRCIICGKRMEKSALFRFVATDRGLVWDSGHCLPGRGAYLHRQVNCWSKATDPGRWERAFRMDKGAISKESINFIRQEVYHHLLDLKPDLEEPAKKNKFSKLRL